MCDILFLLFGTFPPAPSVKRGGTILCIELRESFSNTSHISIIKLPHMIAESFSIDNSSLLKTCYRRDFIVHIRNIPTSLLFFRTAWYHQKLVMSKFLIDNTRPRKYFSLSIHLFSYIQSQVRPPEISLLD